MQIQDESYIKWKLFLEGNDEAYSCFIHTIFNYCINMDYKSLLTQK